MEGALFIKYIKVGYTSLYFLFLHPSLKIYNFDFCGTDNTLETNLALVETAKK